MDSISVNCRKVVYYPAALYQNSESSCKPKVNYGGLQTFMPGRSSSQAGNAGQYFHGVRAVPLSQEARRLIFS